MVDLTVESEQVEETGPLRKILDVSDTTPEVAAKNIDRANLYEMSPDAYKDVATELDKEADSIERFPATVGTTTQGYITQSEQHASLAKDDLSLLDSIEKRVNYYDQQANVIPDLNQQINEISYREIFDPESITDGDREYVQNLNQEISILNQNKPKEIGEAEELGIEVVSAVKDFVSSFERHKELALGILGTGALVGAGTGLAVPIPGTTLIGAKIGFVASIPAVFSAVGFVDGFTQTTPSVFNELRNAVDDQGKPLNIPHEKKARVSIGVGLLSGGLSAVGGKLLATNNPLLKKILNPKLIGKSLTQYPKLMAKMAIMGGIAKSIMSEGIEESGQEVISIIGQEFAKLDDTEASFENSLDNLTTALQKSFTPEKLKQVAHAGVVGGLTGGVIQATTSAPGYSGLKSHYDKVQKMEIERNKVLEAQNSILEIAEDVKQTKMKDLSPNEMSSFKKKVFSAAGIDENVFFDLEDLRTFSTDPDKAKAVRNTLDPNSEIVRMSRELNTPIDVEKADLLDIVTEFPEVTEYMRTDPTGESPSEALTNAQDFATRLETADLERQQLLESLGVDQEITPEIQEQLEELNKTIKDRRPFDDEFDYVSSISFTEREGVITKEEAEVFNTKHLDARLEVARSLKEDVDNKFETIDNRIFRDVNQKDIQSDIESLDREFSIVERFGVRKDPSESARAITKRHKKKGYSPSAIDPKSLPEDLKEIYLKDKTLKKRKVFVDGGVDLEESAALNGVESGAELLDILVNTPKKSEITKNRKQREIELKNRVSQITKPAKLAARDKAFSNLTKIYLREMKYLTSKQWPTLKRGIIKIAGKVPSVANLNSNAKTIVNGLKVRELNANRFLQGERKSQRLALKDYVDGKFESAFANKEKAAQNNELRKETINALEKVNKYESFWKKVSSKSNQQELKDAGMFDAMSDFMTLYRLDGSTRGLTEQNKFNAYVKHQAELGNYVPEIPARLDNTQTSSKDLSFAQYQAITEMGQNILHHSKMKNKLLKKVEKRADLKTAEMVAEDIETNTVDHFDYDPKKAESISQRELSFTERVGDGFATSASAVSSIKTVVSLLDEHKLGGYFHNLIGLPIKEARTAKRQEISDIETHDRNVIEKFYGIDKFKRMFNEFIEVPEFADTIAIGNGEGSIRKIDLLVLQAYMGDPEGRNAMDKFNKRDGTNITLEEVQTVLERELDSNDAAFVQNFLVDRFKRFEERSFNLHKNTSGIEPDMVKGVEIEHKGKVLPGGYFPIKRQMLPDDVKAKGFFESLKDTATSITGADEGHFFAKMRSAEMTQQGRLKERTGSQRPLDITFENVFQFTEEAVHDLHFREVGIDTLKILKNPLNVKNIKSVVGAKKFVTLLNSVKDVVSKTTERESTLHGEEYQLVNNLIQKAHSLHAVKAIGLNLTSAAIQLDSLPNLMLRVGHKTPMYLMKAAAKIGANVTQYNKYVRLAEDINPDVKFEKDGIDDSIVKESYDFIPSSTTFFKKYKSTSGQTIERVKDLQGKAIDASFSLVREMDKFNKVLSTMAISEQFLNGDVKGYPSSKLETMSDKEKADAMRSTVQQAIDLSLTASAPEDKTALEKNKVANIFVRYWTDRRSRLNTVLAQIDKVRGNVKRGENAKAAGNVLMLSLATGASAAYVNWIRDDESLLEKMKRASKADADDVADFALDTTWHFIKAPFDQTLDVIPLIDNIKYQSELELRTDYRSVGTPLFGVASDVAMGIVAMKDVLNMAMKGKAPKLSDVQRKALLTNGGYIVGGAPTNGMEKALQALSSREVKKGAKFIEQELKDLNESIQKYIGMFSDDKNAELFVEDLKEYQKTLPQLDGNVKHVVPEDAKSSIKEISSQGDWNTIDPKTGAAGIYQFTEERWAELMELNPDLGLTENGRVAKNSSQQETAMQWSMDDNARSFMAYEVPVTTENLLGAHKFGLDSFVAIYHNNANIKLSKILGEDAKRPEFEGFKTVKSVKNYLAQEVKKTN